MTQYLEDHVCEKARLARDSRFDGLFFVGVHSTGIFCRPICPAPTPKPENVVFYPTAAAAIEAGLRPCLRCRPEASPGTPAWCGTSATVSRAASLIRQGALNKCHVDDLAKKLGVTGRHLRRLFKTQIGTSPMGLAIAQRVLFAKKLLSETDMSITEIAYVSGFGSIRRFNAAFRRIYHQTPSDLRRRAAYRPSKTESDFRCTLDLSYRPPFDWPAMLSFFAMRAIPGVEYTEGDTFGRTVRINGTTGSIRITPSRNQNALSLRVRLSDSCDLLPIVERVRRMFDLDANMSAIHQVLETDPMLAPLIQKNPGLRLPGAWDPFEVAIRAVVGQQVSVKAARTILGRIVAKLGSPITGSPAGQSFHPKLAHFFPTADELIQCALDGLGMPQKRQTAIKTLAEAVASHRIDFLATQSLPEIVQNLADLPGIGPWTAEYIAMRGLSEPDAFPETDLGIVRAIQKHLPKPTSKQILARSNQWRPWRAYAAIHLWHA